MFLKHDDGIKVLSASDSERRLMLTAEGKGRERGRKLQAMTTAKGQGSETFV